jgi:hypothetical protein
MSKNTETAADGLAPVPTFGKEQILKSRRYEERRDLLAALLKDGERYSHADVQALVDGFMKGKVS